jgi:pyrroloquinoline quinone biosynthesis protein B
LKATLLGAAQDGGVPQAGCQCPRCNSLKLTAASLALDLDDGRTVLIDITPDFRAQSRSIDLKSLDAIYLTHAHWGHYGGLMQLGKEGWNVKGMEVWLSERFAKFILSNEPFASLVRAGNIILKSMGQGIRSRHGIVAEPVIHRAEFTDTVGYSFDLNGRRALYLPDVDRFDEPLRDLIGRHDLVWLDGTFYSGDELPGRNMQDIPHPPIIESAAQLKEFGGKIVFIHFNHTNPVLDRTFSGRVELEVAGFSFGSDGDEFR